jgi:hypothetical protein
MAIKLFLVFMVTTQIGQIWKNNIHNIYSPEGIKIQSPALIVVYVHSTFGISGYWSRLMMSGSTIENPEPNCGN